ncbi:hypothetical protein DJ69_15080 [Halorubrum persicum]|uniref:Uncharacterized protein n=1 Tax=Halorubrum persicum TaxID=1383844 RepID=A0A2G1WFU1_9EURY|nr:hypothetical protein [Halorubrum persicum]PHQ37851.1 hypothetical protein DJ69_15080 [Halorubrum persicum]
MIPTSESDGARERLRDADRGQLLLVSGLVVAVSLVALVVLLNASIYSENVATRGIEAADGEALEVRAAVVEETGARIDTANRNGATTGSEIETGIEELNQNLSGRYARRGGIAVVEPVATTPGWYLSGPVDDSTTIPDVNGARSFSITNESALPPTDTGNASSEAVAVVFNDSATGTTHERYLYAEGDDVVVAGGKNGSTPTERCRSPATGDAVTLAVTGDRFDGDPCPGVWPAGLSDGYDVEFENAGGAGVEATATVDTGTEPTSATALTVRDAVYDATIDFRYRTADLRFKTRIRVAPGEPDA